MTSFGYNVLGFGAGGTGPVSASGGTETTVGDYTVHSFTSSATLTVTVGGKVDYMVIAGAGGAGSQRSGGGGAGGFRTATDYSLP